MILFTQLSSGLNGFQTLNGFEDLNVTGLRDEQVIADFEVKLSVKCTTAALTTKVTYLEGALSAKISVATIGRVSIEAPVDTVNFKTAQKMKCTFNEPTESAGWYLQQEQGDIAVNNGSVVIVTSTCGTTELPSCTTLELKSVTGNWEGVYICAFSSGSVSHKASSQLLVALLPDEITMTLDPQTVDCSERKEKDTVTVTVNATIKTSTENYVVEWKHQGTGHELPVTQDLQGLQTYSLKTEISCKPSRAFVTIIFKNQNEKQKNQSIDIPVIYANTKFCEIEGIWPKTPASTTLVLRICDPGRVGFQERTCEGNVWKKPFSSCIKEELNKVLNVAAKFKEGLGATQEIAFKIFSGLKNVSDEEGDSADVSASISVLDSMSEASSNIALEERVLPDFLGAASNMLNSSWSDVNETIQNRMSAKYLQSVEDLVKNIRIDNEGYNTSNIELKLCNVQGKSNCSQSVFGVEVLLNQSSGTVKTLAVKHLGERLKTENAVVNPLVVSATLQNSTDSKIDIRLDFPIDKNRPANAKMVCVFWNTSTNEWSQDGCRTISGGDNRTYCECNHLTAFSVLMSKEPVDLPYLNEISYVCLGMSICSLLVFLLIETLVWSAIVKSNLSHFRHTALVNIALCLFLADCSFLGASYWPEPSPTICSALAMCQHFFYLAMFFWMLCLSSMLLHQLIFVFHPLRKRVFMLVSVVFGYIFPAMIVGVTYVYYKYTNGSYNTAGCWLKYDGLLNGSIHAFLLPVGTIILMNLFTMAVVTVTLLKSSIPDGGKADQKDTVKSILKVVVFLTPVFGVTWILGFFTLLMDAKKEPLAIIFHYAFSITNGSQGFFILLTGVFAEKKVRDEVLKLILARAPISKSKTESMKNLTTTKTNPK